jgi:hypothetical protein
VTEQNPEPKTEKVERNPAHPVDENPLEHIGEELKDPWSDRTQKDWPANPSGEQR